MTKREILTLLKLPKDTILFGTCGIYNYQIDINESDDLEKWCSIREKGSSRFSSKLCLFKQEETTNPDDFCHYRDYVRYTYPVLRGHMKVGQLYLHSCDTYSTISPIQLKPRSSYKQWINKLK